MEYVINYVLAPSQVPEIWIIATYVEKIYNNNVSHKFFLNFVNIQII